MKFIIYVILAYILYRIFKGFFVKSKEIDRSKQGGVIDEMVQDPFCKTYIPRRDAVRKAIEGEAIFFCSEDCATKYIEEKKG